MQQGISLEQSKALLVICDASDQWEDLPLHEALVRALKARGVAGATAFSGIMGYGGHRRIHRKSMFDVVDQKPVAVLAIDSETKIRSVLVEIRPMVRDGVAFLLDAEAVELPQLGIA